jgi:hypothetical protein
LKATIFPAEEWTTLLDPKTRKPIKGDQYVVDTRRAVVQRNGVLRSRPKILAWVCVVTFEVDETIGGSQLLEDIGNLAGRMVGIGDFRPEKGGPFGRYAVRLLS